MEKKNKLILKEAELFFADCNWFTHPDAICLCIQLPKDFYKYDMKPVKIFGKTIWNTKKLERVDKLSPIGVENKKHIEAWANQFA